MATILSDRVLATLTPYQKSLYEKQLNSNNPIIVNTNDAEKFVKDNNQNSNKKTLGSANTDITTLDPSLGALAPFIDQASGILDNIYGKTVEPTQREKDLNMGRAALKFFTQLGAASSVPGQTALGAANIAGASVAQDYLNKIQSDKDKSDKLEQAKKAGSVSLGMQLFSADQAKDIAELKAKNVKPGASKQYKMLDAKTVVKALGLPLENPSTGELYKDGDVIDLLPNEFNAVPRGNLASFKEVTPAKPNPFEKLRLDVTNVVQKYIGNEDEIDPLDATTFNSSIFQIQRDRFTTIDGDDGTKQTIVQEGLDLLTILKQSYGEEKINKLLERMGVEQKSDTPITDQINNENKNTIEPKEKEVAENGDVTEYNIVKVGNKKIRVLSKKKEKMSKELVVSLANSKQALKDLDLAVSIFFPNGKYNPKISYQTSTLGGNSLGDARVAYQTMKRAIEVILRLRTGAQAPEPEVISYMDQYMPNILDGAVESELKLNALIDFFEEVAKGINEGRRPDDKTWVRRPKSNVIKDTIKDGGQVSGGRKIKIIKNVPHIQKEKGSDIYLPIK